jgi:molybdopterin-guanine dinucleotide biosynthesis protein MobB
MSIIAVVGSKKSGKTTAIETLVRGLTKRGYRIATVKHIPEADFTIDTKGKDTWRHAKAGACIVVSVAPNELATIKKVDTTKYGLGEILRNVEEDVDITILEGFRKLIEQSSAVPKIVAAKTTKGILEASKRFKPILSFVGPIPTEAAKLNIQYIDVLNDPDRLVDLVDKNVATSVEKRRKRREDIRIQIDGQLLPLTPFVQEFVRNTILAMVSTLRDTKIKGDEDLFVTIRRVSRHQ